MAVRDLRLSADSPALVRQLARDGRRRVLSGAPALEFLLRDDFLTDEAAPLASPRACEPGPGTLTLRQLDGAFSVSSGALVYSAQTTPAGGELQLAGDPFDRVTGRTLFLRTTRTTLGLGSFGWCTATVAGSSANFQPFLLDLSTATGRYYTGSLYSEPPDVFASGIAREYAIALRSPGSLLFTRPVGGTWTLAWAERTSTGGPLYPTLENRNAAGTLDAVHVADLAGGFETDYGLATDRLAGAVAQGATFAHEADAVVEWVHTTGPSFGGQAVRFREQDGSNYWRLYTDGTDRLLLTEHVAGVETVRANVSDGSVVNGARVVLVLTGTTIRAYVNGALKITYSSAANFQGATGGRVSQVSSGTLSDLVAWPRTVSGPALAQLDLLAG